MEVSRAVAMEAYCSGGQKGNGAFALMSSSQGEKPVILQKLALTWRMPFQSDSTMASCMEFMTARKRVCSSCGLGNGGDEAGAVEQGDGALPWGRRRTVKIVPRRVGIRRGRCNRDD